MTWVERKRENLEQKNLHFHVQKNLINIRNCFKPNCFQSAVGVVRSRKGFFFCFVSSHSISSFLQNPHELKIKWIVLLSKQWVTHEYAHIQKLQPYLHHYNMMQYKLFLFWCSCAIYYHINRCTEYSTFTQAAMQSVYQCKRHMHVMENEQMNRWTVFSFFSQCSRPLRQ